MNKSWFKWMEAHWGKEHSSGICQPLPLSGLHSSSLPALSISGPHSSSQPVHSAPVLEASHKKSRSMQPRRRGTKSSATTSVTLADKMSAPVMLQSITSQMTQMNDLFECTSEDPDAKACDLAVENLWWLETDLTADEHAYFFDLFLMKPSLAKMYNHLVNGDDEDWRAYIRLKLKSIEGWTILFIYGLQWAIGRPSLLIICYLLLYSAICCCTPYLFFLLPFLLPPSSSCSLSCK